jgi:hypothetical protein
VLNLPIYWFGVYYAENEILLAHIGGFCDHLFTSVHCDVTVVPVKPDLHDNLPVVIAVCVVHNMYAFRQT